MGAVSFSLDRKLVECLKASLPLDVLVETGTFEGDTIANVGELFSEVYSVELSQELYEKTQQRFALQSHVHLYCEQSAHVLAQLRLELSLRSVLYWLDAHWCVAAGTSGETSQCPLLEELAAIQRLDQQSIILIDDARLFLCPPPEPHETSQWPGCHAILTSLQSLSDCHEVMVVNDVIAFFPTAAKPALEEYSRKHSVNWLNVMQNSQRCDRQQEIIQRQRQTIEERRQVIQRLAGKRAAG